VEYDPNTKLDAEFDDRRRVQDSCLAVSDPGHSPCFLAQRVAVRSGQAAVRPTSPSLMVKRAARLLSRARRAPVAPRHAALRATSLNVTDTAAATTARAAVGLQSTSQET
jgi:hypothetical protein